MKKIFQAFIIEIVIVMVSNCVFAEQYLLQCKMDMYAVNSVTNQIMNHSQMERFFIIDTILAEVYDANNQPLNVETFNDEEIVFHHKAASFNTIVETEIKYNQVTKKIILNEIYANVAYTNRAKFVTKGEGVCSVKEIERKPIF